MFERMRKRSAAIGAAILGVVLSAALSLSSQASASADGPIVREVFDGPYVMALEQNSNEFIYLSVSQRADPDAEPLLFYSVATFNLLNQPTLTVVEEGYGTIPTGSFQVSAGNAPERFALSVDTSAAANPSFARTVGSGGLVSASWQRTGFAEGVSNSLGGSRVAHLVFSFKGQSSYSSAKVAGAVVGHPLSGAFGQIGTNNQNAITIDRADRLAAHSDERRDDPGSGGVSP